MRIDCTKKRIDTNKILYGIDAFRAEHYGDKPSYIVMNYKTRNDILDYYYFNSLIRVVSASSITKEERLFDIPIAYNEVLEYGEVDIV